MFFGELQFAFITFILGESVDGFEQWKQMVVLIAFSDDLCLEQPQIFLDFIRKKLFTEFLKFLAILYSQLQQFPEDFFIDTISSNSFMSNCLEVKRIFCSF